MPSGWNVLSHGTGSMFSRRKNEWITDPNLNVLLLHNLYVLISPSELNPNGSYPGENYTIKKINHPTRRVIPFLNPQLIESGWKLEIIVLLSPQAERTTLGHTDLENEGALLKWTRLKLVKDIDEKKGQYEHYSEPRRRLIYVLDYKSEIDTYNQAQTLAEQN